jgi:HEAT repeat protein
MLIRLFCMLLALGSLSDAVDSTAASLEREATEAFKRAEYGAVLKLVQSQPPGVAMPKALLRLAVQSAMKLGHPEEGLDIYERLVKSDQPDDLTLLRQLAVSFLSTYVRDPKEHIRIAAYSALAELSLPDQQSLFEDCLLDSSPLVRARAIEGLGRANLAGKSGPLRRALQDDLPPVRIAAMNALSEAHVTDIVPRLVEVARTEDGPEAVFAYAALYRLGKQDMLADITGAATLPDPETRMAALGVLGRLKRSSSLAVISQGVYDPEARARVRRRSAGRVRPTGRYRAPHPCVER